MNCLDENTAHIPVLLPEVLHALKCNEGGVFIDATFGAGGYTRGILKSSPDSKVFAFDRDPAARKTGFKTEEDFPGRFCFIHDCFGNMLQHITEKADGIVLDLGVSSMQIDQAERGFSFRFDGPLDMRMAQKGISAKDVVNGYSEENIADILFKYGEEKSSYKIARAIVMARRMAPITTTGRLAEIVHGVMPRPKDGSDSAMRTFQALRIFVNDELGELERVLNASLKLLKSGGRLVVVSFHSLEDRLVKNFLIRHAAHRKHVNRYAPEINDTTPLFEIVTRRPVVPGKEELLKNPRSHSAKMRVGIRTKVETP